MRLKNVGITERTAEEVAKLGNNTGEIAQLIGCPKHQVKYWLDGIYTPSAFYLRRFHEIGCDVLYILTGKHYVVSVSGGDTGV